MSQYHWQPGLESIANIVAKPEHMKDIGLYAPGANVAGAQRWADRYGWSAESGDIIGNDGIPEVYVTDSKGNIRMLNGYYLKKSKHPYRAAYYDPKMDDLRETMPYSEFVRQNRAIQGWDGTNWTFYNGPAKYTKEAKVSPKKVFNDLIMKPAWEKLKSTGFTKDNKYSANFLLKVYRVFKEWLFNHEFVVPIIEGMEKNYDDFESKEAVTEWTKTHTDYDKYALDKLSQWYSQGDEMYGQIVNGLIQCIQKNIGNYQQNKPFDPYLFMYRLPTDDMVECGIQKEQVQKDLGEGDNSFSNLSKACTEYRKSQGKARRHRAVREEKFSENLLKQAQAWKDNKLTPAYIIRDNKVAKPQAAVTPWGFDLRKATTLYPKDGEKAKKAEGLRKFAQKKRGTHKVSDSAKQSFNTFSTVNSEREQANPYPDDDNFEIEGEGNTL